MRPRPSWLARYELHPAESERLPPDWDALFGRRAPRVVELGFGNGDYLAHAAREHPERDFVGIEQPQECLIRGAAALHAAGAENARLVRGDGRYLLRELFAPASLCAVLVQFPMPWPKERHAKHRVTGPRLTETLADVLEPGGQFELVTDQDWFAASAHADFQAHGGFALDLLESPGARPFRTRYELRWLAQGRSLWRVRARLLRPQQAPRYCGADRMDVQRLAAPSPAQVQALAGARFQAPGSVAEVKEVFAGAAGWLLRVVTADDSFTQFFYLRLEPRPPGQALLRIEAPPRPYPTRAVRLLLESVARALSGSGPDSGPDSGSTAPAA